MSEWERMYQRAQRLKEQYKPGTRIKCISMCDPWSPVIPGTRGTVTSVDDAGTIHMKWDNGRTLGLIPGEDLFKVIEEAPAAVVFIDSKA